MASQPPHGFADKFAAQPLDMPPSVRELRAQSVQRLQAGLFGLAAIVLVVGLANIINDRARMTETGAAARNAAAASQAETAQGDPLADIGVVPSPTASAPDGQPAPATTAAGNN
jgi:hypothetical protein